ncbi:MAG TPA: prenyltransferase/squalene oxidase repeat-containing protein [Pirellulales bacterium]|nr:prenyltransferase/squalene oxidase repeat-containing protein [Pirellulales bacterium]
MSTADSDALVRPSVPVPPSATQVPGPKPAPVSASARHSGALWLDGDVLSCACPDCAAPMSIRLWLRLADCWRCGASVELTNEQHALALRLLEARTRGQPGQRWSQPVERPQPAPQPAAAPAARMPVLPPPRQAPATESPEAVAPLPNYLITSSLVSLLVHMVLIILLGLWFTEPRETSVPLLLSATISDVHQPGEARIFDRLDEGTKFAAPDLKPLPSSAEVASFDKREPLAEVIPTIALPSGDVLSALGPPTIVPTLDGGRGNLLAGRNPHLRASMLKAEGGTTETEAAVARGLQWISKHQDADGHWSLDHFADAGNCDCGDRGGHSDTAGTALALLPFLGAGQSHWNGGYHMTVAKGLRALLDRQGADGDLRGEGVGTMYAHGQAAIALCEAYAMTKDSLLHAPAQRAIDFIVAAQHPAGGWRYRPGQAGDTSVVGWQLMALRSAQTAGLNVPEQTFARAMKFLDTVQYQRGQGMFSYMPHGSPSEAMTAEGLLSRQYSGWKLDDPAMVAGIAWLAKRHPVDPERPNMYYWYYATQAIHHFGGPTWEQWNADMRDALVASQETQGHEAGSWTPRREHDVRGGRLYMTALAVCTLEVYYRHLPLYQREAIKQKARN